MRRDTQGNASKSEHPDFHARMQQQIGGDDAGNGTRCTDERRLGIGQDHAMQERSGGGAEKIEDQELDVPKRIFDIVAENPEEQHVAAEMEDVGMQESVGDVGEIGGTK